MCKYALYNNRQWGMYCRFILYINPFKVYIFKINLEPMCKHNRCYFQNGGLKSYRYESLHNKKKHLKNERGCRDIKTEKAQKQDLDGTIAT